MEEELDPNTLEPMQWFETFREARAHALALTRYFSSGVSGAPGASVYVYPDADMFVVEIRRARWLFQDDSIYPARADPNYDWDGGPCEDDVEIWHSEDDVEIWHIED